MSVQKRFMPRTAVVRRLMLKHGLSEPSAKSLALMVYGDARNG